MGSGAHHDKETKNASRRRRRLKEKKINEYFLSKLCIIKNEIPSFKKKRRNLHKADDIRRKERRTGKIQIRKHKKEKRKGNKNGLPEGRPA